MGVNGLWKLLEPVGRPVTLESLENQTLAVDISLWLHQALYGMRNQHGNTVPNAHLVLLFQRICKLLFYRVKPIFVFDGGVPELKKKTMAARREFRSSAHRKAKTISEKVLKKYIKSRVLGDITGKTSQKSIDSLKELETKRDLFDLSPLPEEKQISSAADEESFGSFYNFQDFEGVDIDSDDFRKLPPEMQHEIIVEMHEKSKRHSRYQEIHMPEESGDFSDFQLKHLLKRGKLTQRLGVIRKEMNEQRVGEFAANIDESEISGDTLVLAQKIMSEESGHFILIKKSEKQKITDKDITEDALAGGFFRDEVSAPKEVKDPVLPSIVPPVKKMAPFDVIHGLDENTSSSDEDNMTEKILRPGDSQISSPNLEENGCSSSTTGSVPLSGDLQQTNKEPMLDYNPKPSVEIIQEDNIENQMKSESTTKEGSVANISINDNLISNVSKTSNENQACSEIPENEIEFIEEEKELDRFEDEIKERKMLIEKLLTMRNNPKPVQELNVDPPLRKMEEVIEPSNGDSIMEDGDITSSDDHLEMIDNESSDKAVIIEDDDNDKKDDNPYNNDQDNNVGSSNLTDSQNIPNVENEFRGMSQEDLEGMQEKLDEDLENLKEERSRQTRLAATVSDEMYKDSQELLQLFGIPFVVSPMEAEAQCATLNTKNLCDGSITEDSDIILFGAKKVYKNIFNQNKNAEVYNDDDIRGVLGLDRLTLITLALLTGSDYTEGIQGIGIVSAMEAIHEFAGYGIDKLKNLKNWLNEESARNNSSNQTKLKSKLKNIKLPPGFPSEQVFEAYLNPTVDDSSETFSWATPDLYGLRLFASEKLGWSKHKTDEILLPVLKRINSRETQPKINAFFPVQFSESKRIKSRRVKRVVSCLLNKDSQDDNGGETTSSKKRKAQPKCQTTESKKENTKKGNDTKLKTEETTHRDSSTDSTSDTSEEEGKNYVPQVKMPTLKRGAGQRGKRRGRTTVSRTKRR